MCHDLLRFEEYSVFLQPTSFFHINSFRDEGLAFRFSNSCKKKEKNRAIQSEVKLSSLCTKWVFFSSIK